MDQKRILVDNLGIYFKIQKKYNTQLDVFIKVTSKRLDNRLCSYYAVGIKQIRVKGAFYEKKR